MRAAGGGGGAFTPLDLSPLAWADFSDAATVTTVSGRVTSVADKSGNSTTIEALATREPNYVTAGINGLNAIQGDGINDGLATNVDIIDDLNWIFSLFIVLDPNSNVTQLLEWASVYDAANRALDYEITATGSQWYWGGGWRNSVDWSSDVPQIICARSAGDAAPEFVTRLNGQYEQTSNGLSSRTGVFLSLGSAINGYNDALFGELLIFDNFISDEDTKKVEGYLPHKWGLTGSLPADHPYKSVAP
jgi:hypothetical protein